MQYSLFPKTKKKVSKLGFGAFGLKGVFGSFDETEAIGAMHYCWDQGVNFLDTARHYGESERIVGKALKSWSGDAPFLATKAECIGPVRQWGIPLDVEACFPKGHITREAENSLKELGVESIDLFQMHLYWPNWGVEGYWLDELNALQEQGKVGAIGVSMPDQRHDAALPLVLSGRIQSVQAVFNIFDPTPLDCLIPICAENEVAVLARCVLDEGGLTGFLSQETAFAEDDFRANYFDQGPRDLYLEKVGGLRKFLPEHAGSLASLALKFVTMHPGVTTALSSMNIREHAEANVAAMEEEPLSDEVFTEIRFYHRWIHNFYSGKSL
ncbi:MAG: aldo/keto reductase [Verrucomicrobia bacterium]|jgi:aryl-alcohol dehydrogenase-like predicted oxidoreductase|nr:aldo/keto reductase [Verrucomicrobiota bacterium]|tara:strand:+ start:6645 stop:7622 length:978 start_codon:yes stop_codon:yes gene_type:complete